MSPGRFLGRAGFRPKVSSVRAWHQVVPEVETRRRRGPGTAYPVLLTSGWPRCCRRMWRMWHSRGHQSSLPDGGARAWRRGRAAQEAPGPSQAQVAPHSLLCRFYSGHHLGCLQGQNLPWLGGWCPSCRDRGLGISFRGWRLSRLLKLSLGPQTPAHAAPNFCLSWQTPEHPSKPSLDDTSPEKTSWRPRGRIPPLCWLLVVDHTGSQNDRKWPRVGLDAPQRREPEHLLPF